MRSNVNALYHVPSYHHVPTRLSLRIWWTKTCGTPDGVTQATTESSIKFGGSPCRNPEANHVVITRVIILVSTYLEQFRRGAMHPTILPSPIHTQLLLLPNILPPQTPRTHKRRPPKPNPQIHHRVHSLAVRPQHPGQLLRWH